MPVDALTSRSRTTTRRATSLPPATIAKYRATFELRAKLQNQLDEMTAQLKKTDFAGRFGLAPERKAMNEKIKKLQQQIYAAKDDRLYASSQLRRTDARFRGWEREYARLQRARAILPPLIELAEMAKKAQTRENIEGIVSGLAVGAAIVADEALVSQGYLPDIPSSGPRTEWPRSSRRQISVHEIDDLVKGIKEVDQEAVDAHRHHKFGSLKKDLQKGLTRVEANFRLVRKQLLDAMDGYTAALIR